MPRKLRYDQYSVFLADINRTGSFRYDYSTLLQWLQDPELRPRFFDGREGPCIHSFAADGFLKLSGTFNLFCKGFEDREQLTTVLSTTDPEVHY